MTVAASAKERSGINFTCRDLALQLVQVRCCWFQSQKSALTCKSQLPSFR